MGALTLFMTIGLAATHISKPARNLRVLPKDISDQRLDSLMNVYNKALGVNCAFCHSKSMFNPSQLDYAMDGNPMKEEGRRMIRLTMSINKDYFRHDTTIHPAYLTSVTCNTCHRGEAYPEH